MTTITPEEQDALRERWCYPGFTAIAHDVGRLLDALGEMRRERDEARNLLAIIHGDGGHYLDEHGWTKACKDAVKKWYEIKRNVGRGE